MNIINKCLRTLYKIHNILAIHGLYNKLPDDTYIKKRYKAHFGFDLNLEQPTRFNEKLQWLKLNDKRLDYITMVDKYAVKNYVADLIGADYIIPTLGVWNNPNEIDFDSLPDKFVLKCNHNSGLGMYICRDKSKMNISKIKKNLWKGLKQDYYLTGREWPYKKVPRKIIAETFMSDGGIDLTDYKVHNFNGIPKFILVCRDRFSKSGLTEDFYSTCWEHLDVKRPNIPNSKVPIAKPDELDEILELSRKLSVGIPFVRTDFYIINHQVYFSEITFFPASGFEKYEPDEWDYVFGDYLKLSR